MEIAPLRMLSSSFNRFLFCFTDSKLTSGLKYFWVENPLCVKDIGMESTIGRYSKRVKSAITEIWQKYT